MSEFTFFSKLNSKEQDYYRKFLEASDLSNKIKWDFGEYVIRDFFKTIGLDDIRQIDWLTRSNYKHLFWMPERFDVEVKLKSSLMSFRYAWYNKDQINRQLRFLNDEWRRELYCIVDLKTQMWFVKDLHTLYQSWAFIVYKGYDVIDTEKMDRIDVSQSIQRVINGILTGPKWSKLKTSQMWIIH